MTSSSTRALLEEVLRGLRKSPKEIHCKYFYDEVGSQLFDRICELEEYYLTRTELSIMRRHAGEMAATLGAGCTVIEYGSGSSLKTPILLDALREPVAYVPIDISCEHLLASAARIAQRYPDLEVLPLCADYSEPVELPAMRREARLRVVYFPGSTIGNFTPQSALPFLRRVAVVCGAGGGLLIGADLDKDPAVIERAYNDAEGVTAAFNLNLLTRFNRELGTDFDVGSFRHHAVYNRELRRIEMYLTSRRQQTVHLGAEEVRIEEGESLLTEYSYKYRLEDFEALAASAGFEVRQVWTDAQRLFSVQYLTVR